MIARIKKFFKIQPQVNFAKLFKDGALIVDVRSPEEYKTGHIKGSVNIPVDWLRNNPPQLKNKLTAVITCCASGMRSSLAKNILDAKGFSNVYNGGAWKSLNEKLN
jgi:phage shock protein E